MSVKPILFNTEMVKAILEGRKTVTRRIVKLENSFDGDTELIYSGKCAIGPGLFDAIDNMRVSKIPPYKKGDVLYVRETWCAFQEYPREFGFDVLYKADELIKPCIFRDIDRYEKFSKYEDAPHYQQWLPSLFMPKEAARIWLKVTDVKVEKLQDITSRGAWEEGAMCTCMAPVPECAGNREEFERIWDSTISKSDIDYYGWNANPWVWVIEFERCEKPQEVEA